MSFTILERRICVSSSRGERKKKEKKTGLARNGWSRSDESFISICSSPDGVCHLSSFLTRPIQGTRRINEPHFHGWKSLGCFTSIPLVSHSSAAFRERGNVWEFSQGGKSGELNSFPGFASLWLTIFLVRVIIKCNVSLNLWVYCET